MHVRDWRYFLERGQGKEIEIAQLSDQMTAHLGASSKNVILAHEYAVKAAIRHRMPAEQFPMIFETVDHGIALADRELHITFLYHDKVEWDRWFQVVVKRSFETKRIYISTFYKTKPTEVARKLKLHPIIRQ